MIKTILHTDMSLLVVFGLYGIVIGLLLFIISLVAIKLTAAVLNKSRFDYFRFDI